MNPSILSTRAIGTISRTIRPQSIIPHQSTKILIPTLQPLSHRHASTNTSTTIPPPPPSSSTSTPSTSLTWNQFFTLRQTRRRYQTVTSLITALTSTVTGAQVLVSSDMEALVSQIPIDPFIALGLITFSCGGVGWLLGPVVGTGLFNVRNGATRKEMERKEREFFGRVKRFRVDPSASSVANPVPDYYGEKISSVQGYRQWLKDQRAFNKKRQTFVK